LSKLHSVRSTVTNFMCQRMGRRRSSVRNAVEKRFSR